MYLLVVNITHPIINEGFSEKVITPGISTTDDVVWWFRKKIRDLEEHAYILKPGETALPERLRKAMIYGNQLQDKLTSVFGTSGAVYPVVAIIRCIPVSII